MSNVESELQVIERRLQGERVVSSGEPAPEFRQGGPPVVLLYPSPYRAGMSSLGFQWILTVLRRAGLSVERAFLPDDVDAWRRSRRPLLSYETRTPVSHFPVVAVSLAYELELAGLVTALDLAGIPALRRDRGAGDPLVVLGGPITFSNPLPAAAFADAMLLGEADDTVLAIGAGDRGAIVEAIAGSPGGYVPARHGTTLPPTAQSATLPARGGILAPDAELSGMFLVEPERGCHRACTFCVMRRGEGAGMRLVSAEALLALVPEEAHRVGLVGAAVSDHPGLVDILGALVETGHEVGVSSLRADRVARKPEIPRLLRAAGYQTLTVASDAASQRLRRQIVKGTTEAHLLACAEAVAEHGFRTLKVYMMLGLPDETDEDIEELVAFSRKLATVSPVALGIAPFVPKRNTPLDGAVFAGVRLVEKRLARLKQGLRGAVEVRATSARWAWVEAELAQGGPETGEAVARAVRGGGSFSAWKRALGEVPEESKAPWRH